MRKAKYDMYWCSYNWFTATNEKNYRADGRRNYKFWIKTAKINAYGLTRLPE